jgi:hypothetical protein
MSRKNFGKMTVLIVVFVGISVGHAWADKLQLQEKLSEPVSVKLSNVTMAEALEKIGQKAGVKIVLSDEAIWKLPHGLATKLSVVLEGPLSESLAEMLNAFFMRYALGDEKITIYPRPELEHILGTPTAKQLEVLKKIYSMKLSVSGGAESSQLAKLINQGFGPEGLVVVPTQHYEEFESALSFADETPFTLAQLLESAGEMAWYLCGMDFPNQAPEVRVVREEDFREAKLDQIVDISFEDETAEAIIRRLANWTGMELLVEKKEASWLSDKISVEMQNVKLRQALRNVVSTMDGDFYADAGKSEICVYGPKHPKQPPAPRTSKSGDYVGKISIPMDGGKYYIEFMLREEDLTEELRRLWKEKMTAILKEPELLEIHPATGKSEAVKKRK